MYLIIIIEIGPFDEFGNIVEDCILSDDFI